MSKYADFFDALGNKSPSTINGYRCAILKYMQSVYSSETVTRDNVSDYVDTYFTTDRDYFQDFKKSIKDLPDGTAPLGALQYFNQIFNFHNLSDVVFSQKERDRLKNQLPAGGKGSVVAEETVLDHDTLRSLLKHLDTLSKAAILCMATGGMRIGELLRVKCSDIDLKSTPARIYIRAMVKNSNGGYDHTKTKKGRYTFVTPETVDALREWIKVRGAYLESASKKGQNFKTKKATVSIEDDRLFPCSDTTINEALSDAVRKTTGENAKCPITGRSLIHAHGLRKFFVSQLSFSTSLDFADFLAGHVNAITKTYCQLGPEQLGARYLTGMHVLYIEVPAEIRDVVTIKAQMEQTISTDKEQREKDRVEAQKIRNQTTDATNKLTLYMAENAELKLRLEAMKEENDQKIAALQSDVAGLVEFMRKALDGEDIIQAHGKLASDAIVKQPRGKRGE